MPIILSISQIRDRIWAAGPEGLFLVENVGDGVALRQVMQPQQHLYCCAALDDRILVGGAPYGAAFSFSSNSDNNFKAMEEGWQAAWMDNLDVPVICLAPAPDVAESGVILAGTEEGGVLRSVDRGRTWAACNFGLQSYTVLGLFWAPPAPQDVWPSWEMVFAVAENGVYRSPAGGRAWKLCDGTGDNVFQTLAVATDFHSSGLVLAGTEGEGLWRSDDGGHSFQPVAGAPADVNALAATADGWLLSDSNGLWRSPDGLTWQAIPGSEPALVLAVAPQGVLAGGEAGITVVPGV